MIIIPETGKADRDRTDSFADLARRRAGGEMVMSPILLPPYERRLYVRRTLREDHQFRIRNRPEGADEKFDKLAKSLFKFFRGTALLYYRDYAGADSHLPVVFTIGDVHPENFGVMPNEDGAPIFGVNDFDEAYFAPFSYDIKRGAVGFYIAAKENGFKKKRRKAIVRAFVEGYLQGLREFAQDDREKWHEYRLDNSPEMIRELLNEAKTGREDFLAEMVDLENEEFVSNEEIVPHSKYVTRFQEIVDDYRKRNKIDEEGKPDGFFKVKDVAVKKGSGTASLGLDRYFVLIEGPAGEAARDIILEMKQARRSVLHGLVPDPSEVDKDGKVDNDRDNLDVEAHAVHLAGGDPFYGRVEIDGEEFLVRERSPFKDDIDIEDLDDEEMETYAAICGKTLAQTHARSDADTGIMEGNAEERILQSVQPDVFVDDVVRFAKTAYKRIKADYSAYKKDHEIGVFSFFHQNS